MDFIKKGFLLLICIFCAVLLISPVDFLPGLHIDDVIYVIGAIASLSGAISTKKASSDKYELVNE